MSEQDADIERECYELLLLASDRIREPLNKTSIHDPPAGFSNACCQMIIALFLSRLNYGTISQFVSEANLALQARDALGTIIATLLRMRVQQARAGEPIGAELFPSLDNHISLLSRVERYKFELLLESCLSIASSCPQGRFPSNETASLCDVHEPIRAHRFEDINANDYNAILNDDRRLCRWVRNLIHLDNDADATSYALKEMSKRILKGGRISTIALLLIASLHFRSIELAESISAAIPRAVLNDAVIPASAQSLCVCLKIMRQLGLSELVLPILNSMEPQVDVLREDAYMRIVISAARPDSSEYDKQRDDLLRSLSQLAVISKHSSETLGMSGCSLIRYLLFAAGLRSDAEVCSLARAIVAQLPKVRDALSTNSHVSLSRLHVVDSIGIAIDDVVKRTRLPTSNVAWTNDYVLRV